MPVICPSVLAKDKDEYRRQMEVVAGFAERVQIDLTDGEFAKSATLAPEDAWWPVGVKADFHLMYKDPHRAADVILEHRPNMIIVHAEASGNFLNFASRLKRLGIKVGVALLPNTQAENIIPALDHIDHVLIFSGSLGEFGGHARLDLLGKARQLKSAKRSLEIGWDGGINNQNVAQLVAGGVDVLDVGGYIQHSDDPKKAYKTLDRIAQEMGTT